MGHLLKIDAAWDAGVILFGAKSSNPQPTFLGATILVIALIVAIVVGWWNWREANEGEATDSPEDLLASFEEAHEAGELDDDEIKRLRARLMGASPSSATRKVPPTEDPPRSGMT